MKPKFPKLVAALQDYDATAAERQRLWDAILTDDDLEKAQAADRAALRKVQMAFFSEPDQPNCVDNCLLVDIENLRRFANATVNERPAGATGVV